MDKKYFSIGMAGHIDHGKTSLTKALTNIDTDRLKEEQERNISIELGFAPLDVDNSDLQISIIDVPGHERFIRQMISGVTGIDLVMLIVAADEGVMPQTKEHLDILHLLGVQEAIVVITKIDRVEEELLELVEEDIRDHIAHTSFKEAPILAVDSISRKGIEPLKKKIESLLMNLPNRDVKGSFRLPIDQVFTVQGQGTVVRGTIYEGAVREEDSLMILPSQKKGRVRQLQVHKEKVSHAHAGQRAAINIGGIDRSEINRGDVLVKSDHFIITNTIDVTLQLVDDMQYPLKQRALIKVHTGTAEVMGNIVFFDRNDVKSEAEEILCQIRLHENIVARRGDRYIVRRPTPVETIGGGWIIDPRGEKYRFGSDTIAMLEQKREGTPEDRIASVLDEKKSVTLEELIQETSLDKEELQEVIAMMEENRKIVKIKNYFVLCSLLDSEYEHLEELLITYHKEHPLRYGMNKPELKQQLQLPPKMVDTVLSSWESQGMLKKRGPFISSPEFEPHYPPAWEKRMQEVMTSVENDFLQVKPFHTYGEEKGIPSDLLDEMLSYLVSENKVVKLDEKHVITSTSYQKAINELKDQTENIFGLKEAKDTWGVSRKYLIPLLEKMDEENITKRHEGEREWVSK